MFGMLSLNQPNMMSAMLPSLEKNAIRLSQEMLDKSENKVSRESNEDERCRSEALRLSKTHM
jgi:hypothetical protein